MPKAAGTMVVGMVASTPPVRPPNRSMAIVTNVATIPANNAERRIEVCNILIQTDQCGQFVRYQFENNHALEHSRLPSSTFDESIQTPSMHSID